MRVSLDICLARIPSNAVIDCGIAGYVGHREQATCAVQNTLNFHYGKHHIAYATNMNKQLEGTDLADKPLEEVRPHPSAQCTGSPSVLSSLCCVLLVLASTVLQSQTEAVTWVQQYSISQMAVL